MRETTMLARLTRAAGPAALSLAALAAPARAASAFASIEAMAPKDNSTSVNMDEQVHALAIDPPAALPQSAPDDDLRWQPALDFDTDGCYNVPAVDASGNLAEGLPHSWVGLASDCRDESDLDNNNVYSRRRCNGGWCAYLYGYYFEKDVAIPNFEDPGHTHDWEHIAVWVRDGTAEYVGASQHGGFEVKKASDVRWEGDHPKMVYHKDGWSTHCFRFGNTEDDNIENHKGVWFRGALVGYDGYPEGIRDILEAHDFGAANFALKDASFPGSLERALPDGVEFDVNLDE